MSAGAVYVCIVILCLCMLQGQSTSPAKASSPSGKCPQHLVLVPQGTLCLPLPGTRRQAAALLLGSGTACFEHQCHGKQKAGADVPVGTIGPSPQHSTSYPCGSDACRHLPLCCWTPRPCWTPPYQHYPILSFRPLSSAQKKGQVRAKRLCVLN